MSFNNSNPLSYLGIKETDPPQLIKSNRNPAATDFKYDIGDIWINELAQISYILVSKLAGVATWALISPGASDVDTINALPPVAGNITIAGGTNLTDVNAGNTVTLNLDPAITLATSVTSPLYTSGAGVDNAISAPAGQDIIMTMGDAAGANKVSFVDSASVEVFAIDSNGGIGALAGLTVTGALTQTAGAVNVGMDNLGSAINIGGGNVAKALAIGGGAGAHTVAIGSAAAGAITIDTAAGVSIDSATASNFTVTGAADLTLASVGGSINVSGSQAAIDAVNIDASDAAGGIDIDAGTGGITIDTTGAYSIDGAAASNVSVAGAGIDLTLASAAGRVVVNGEEAAADAVRILSAAGGLDANVALSMNLDSSQAAADAIRIVASNAAGGLDIDSGTAGITIDSTGVLSIDSAGATNLTATGAFDVTVSSTAGSTIISGGEAAADAVQITATDAAAGGVLITSGIGGIAANAVGAAAPMTLDSVGVMEINSSGGVIGIGNDAVAQNMNIGTGAAARTITVGNASGATSVVVNAGTGAASFGANATDHTTTVGSTTGVSSTVIQSGTGKITVTGTVDDLTADFTRVSGSAVTFSQSPVLQSNASTGAAPTGATGDVNIVSLQDGLSIEQFVLGAGQTIIAPRMDATGLLVSGDLTNAEGYEYNFGAARANSKHSFTIGTSPAFYLQWRFTIADVSGLEPCYIGFRKTQANDATFANYTDFVAYGPNDGISPGDCAISTQLNTGGLTNTDTNDAWADGTTHTLRINVSAAGVVTFTFDGAPPTVTQAFTFDNGDVVHPFFRHTFNAAAPGAIHWVSMECGFQ